MAQPGQRATLPTGALGSASDAPFSDDAQAQRMSETNGAPTVGELTRRLDSVDRLLTQIDAKMERYASVAVETRLNDIDRRIGTIERTQTSGQTTRTNATWQALFLVLGVLGSMAVGVGVALLIGGGG